MAEATVDVYDAMPFEQAFAAARAKGAQMFPWKGQWYNTEVAQPGKLATPQSVATAVNPYTLGPAAGGTMQPGTLATPQSTATPVNPFSLMPSAGGGPPPAPVAPDFIDLVAQRSPPISQAAPSAGYDMGFTPPGTPAATPMLGGSGAIAPVAMTGAPPAPTPPAQAPAVPQAGQSLAGMGSPIPGNTPAPGVGDMINNIMPQEMNAGPAKTPEEAQARVSGWQKFLDKVKQDPNLMMALIKFGTDMMQPIQPGQTLGGHFGLAVQGGMDYLGQLQNQQSARALQAAEAQRLGAGTEQVTRQTALGLPEAQVAHTRAQTTQLGAATEHTAAETRILDLERQLKQLDVNSKPEIIIASINKLKAEGALSEAHAQELEQELKAGKPQAVVDALKAHAEYWRESRQHISSQYQWKENVKKALMKKGWSEEDATIETNRIATGAGAAAAGKADNAENQLRLAQTLYASEMADPTSRTAKRKMTFEQFVADQIAYGAFMKMSPEDQGLLISRIGAPPGAPRPGQPPGAGTPPPPAAAAPSQSTYGARVPQPAPSTPGAAVAPPPGAIQLLREHPELADQFREKYKVDPAQYLKP